MPFTYDVGLFDNVTYYDLDFARFTKPTKGFEITKATASSNYTIQGGSANVGGWRVIVSGTHTFAPAVVNTPLYVYLYFNSNTKLAGIQTATGQLNDSTTVFFKLLWVIGVTTNLTLYSDIISGEDWMNRVLMYKILTSDVNYAELINTNQFQASNLELIIKTAAASGMSDVLMSINGRTSNITGSIQMGALRSGSGFPIVTGWGDQWRIGTNVGAGDVMHVKIYSSNYRIFYRSECTATGNNNSGNYNSINSTTFSGGTMFGNAYGTEPIQNIDIAYFSSSSYFGRGTSFLLRKL